MSLSWTIYSKASHSGECNIFCMSRSTGCMSSFLLGYEHGNDTISQFFASTAEVGQRVFSMYFVKTMVTQSQVGYARTPLSSGSLAVSHASQSDRVVLKYCHHV
jgi:hypothetical protein